MHPLDQQHSRQYRYLQQRGYSNGHTYVRTYLHKFRNAVCMYIRTYVGLNLSYWLEFLLVYIPDVRTYIRSYSHTYICTHVRSKEVCNNSTY